MIPRLILDASVALAWFVRATDEQSRYAEGVLALIERDATACAVPHLWHVEIANQLRVFKVSGKMTRVKQLNALHRLEALTLSTHHIGLEVRQVLELAERYHIAAYDALYVFLAARDELPLATLDDGMAGAAQRAGVEVVEP
jgi:predicted nucleic acid-binding protein